MLTATLFSAGSPAQVAKPAPAPLRNVDGLHEVGQAPGEDWITVVRKNGTDEFVAAFALNAPCIRVERIAAFFAATSNVV
jgi:hypothetical protein